jgi:hypothetical protein
MTMQPVGTPSAIDIGATWLLNISRFKRGRLKAAIKIISRYLPCTGCALARDLPAPDA